MCFTLRLLDNFCIIFYGSWCCSVEFEFTNRQHSFCFAIQSKVVYLLFLDNKSNDEIAFRVLSTPGVHDSIQ